MVLSEARGYSFFWLSEGAYSLSRDSWCSEHTLRLTRLRMLTLEPKSQKNRKAHHQKCIQQRTVLHPTLKVLVVSDVLRRNEFFLPHEQSDGCDLACQRETRQMRLHTSDKTSLIKVLGKVQRSSPIATTWRPERTAEAHARAYLQSVGHSDLPPLEWKKSRSIRVRWTA
jgi:hypothetical protein